VTAPATAPLIGSKSLGSCWCWSVAYGADCSEGLWIAALLRLAASGTSNPGLTGCRTASDRKRTHDPQTLRYPRSEAAPDLLGANPCCCLEGRCHRRRHLTSVIVLGFVVYELSKIVAHAGTTATSSCMERSCVRSHRSMTSRVWCPGDLSLAMSLASAVVAPGTSRRPASNVEHGHAQQSKPNQIKRGLRVSWNIRDPGAP
jgi:hypothetical protein